MRTYVNVESVAPYVIDEGMALTPEQVPDALRRLRKRSRLSMATLARKIGMAGASSYQRYESDERLEYIVPSMVRLLEQALVGLGVPPITAEEVWELAGNLRSIEENLRPASPEFVNLTLAHSTISPYGARDLPIQGRARSGEDSYHFENGAQALAFTYRPMELYNVRDAYAVYVHGDSMHPRFKHGELVYVDPHRPAAPGDDVVIQLKNDQGFIKELVRRTARAVICKQFNPAGEVEYLAAEVRSVHLIITATKVRV